MANTTNLDLVKPAGTDKALVSVINANSDKIDAFAGTTNQALSNVSAPTNITASSLANLKTNLLTAVNNVGDNHVLAVRFTAGFTEDGFENGFVYIGHAYNISKANGTTNYFSAVVTNQAGVTISIGYDFGTWRINQLTYPSRHVYQISIAPNSSTKLAMSNHDVALIMGFAGQDGSECILLRKFQTTLNVVNLNALVTGYTGHLTFTCESDGVVIESTSSQNSYFTVFKGTGL
jgi:hypothetical protein